MIIKETSRLAIVVAVISLMCMSLTSTSFAASNGDNSNKHSPTEVINALDQKSRGIEVDKSKQILDDVLLPSSMDIETPNVNMDKVIITTPLHAFEYDFKKDLRQHGFTEEEIANFSYEDYKKAESNWKLNEKQISVAKKLYPKLENVDLSNWTNADLRNYYTKMDKDNLTNRFNKEQLQQLKQKGINFEDVLYLFKEFHTVDAILSQPDAKLRETIKDYYQFKIYQVELLATTPDQSMYTQLNMPRYGVDWFHNDVVTSDYWLQIQSDRTLVALRELYNIGFSSFNGYVTNMYGTYSVSQTGAHEGIDFAYGGIGTSIYAIFDGTDVLTGGYYHQLSVYDDDVNKTYNYLHMSDVNMPSGSVTHGNYVGKQGDEGNALGAHVHFEVQSGETTSLSSGRDDDLESISPYQLHIYLGEL